MVPLVLPGFGGGMGSVPWSDNCPVHSAKRSITISLIGLIDPFEFGAFYRLGGLAGPKRK
jgi:hypothetical protein